MSFDFNYNKLTDSYHSSNRINKLFVSLHYQTKFFLILGPIEETRRGVASALFEG